MTKGQAKSQELNPWNRRPWAASGIDDRSELYSLVGAALTGWERYEAVLGAIFCDLVTSGSNIFPAFRAFSAVRTFEGRVEMIRAASEAYYSDHPNEERQNQLKEIVREAKNFSPNRNDIAHGIVAKYAGKSLDWRDNLKSIDEPPYALYPSYATFRNRDLNFSPEYCYSRNEIMHFVLHFSRIQTNAFNFWDRSQK